MSINKLFVNNCSYTALFGNISTNEFINSEPKRADKGLYEDRSTNPTAFNTFCYLFYTFFIDMIFDILNTYTFTEIKFKVRPHLTGLVQYFF